MSLRLYPPGTRGHKHYYVRGSYKGVLIEKSTGETDKKRGDEFRKELQNRLSKTTVIDAADAFTFAQAAQQYINWRKPSDRDIYFIERICSVIGGKFIDEIKQSDMVLAADVLYPADKFKASTRNRAVTRMFAAVMHYAHDNGSCPYLRVKAFREPTAATRYTADATEQWLHMALRGDPVKRLLVLWLFRQGDRISDVLGIRYEDCDTESMFVNRHISKTDSYTTQPLDPIISRYLARQIKRGATGKIFTRWSSRHSVYNWLRPLCQGLGVSFTPHMARHTLGKRMSDAGVSLRPIMDKLGHRSVASSMRYQRGDIEGVRAASEKTKNLGKNLVRVSKT